MNTKKTVAHNALWNWAGMATHMLVGFIIAPFLIHALGDETYGLWIIIGSLTGYFNVLDLGVGGSVGRNIAFFKARNDIAGVNGILNTACLYLSFVAVVSLLATAAALFLFVFFIDIQPNQLDSARFALFLVGLNFALSLPLQTFDGVLWAYQRFDLQNGADIPTVLIRAGLTYWLIGSGYGLVALAAITLATTWGGLVVKLILARRLEPGLRVSLSYISREAAKGLFGYGLWYFIFSLIRTINPQVILLIVGGRLGPALVTPFSVASRLIGYANQFLVAGTGVITPVATALHASDDDRGQRELFVAGGRGCLAFTLMFVSLFVFLGEPLLRLWMGRRHEAVTFPLLLILTAGQLLPMSQQITFSMLLGKGRLRVLAASTLVEMTLSIVLAMFLSVPGYELECVCVAVAVPWALCRGIVPLVYACRVLEVPLLSYLYRAFLPATLVAVGPALVLGLITRWWTPTNWVELFASGGLFAIVYIGIAGVALFGVQVWRDLARRVTVATPKSEIEPELVNITDK